MPSAVSPKQVAETNNYDNAVDDFLRDLPLSPSAARPNLPTNNADPDAEIKIRKPRRPAPKLDEALLLSSAGIPKLRHHANTKLKFKGKGHEFSDIANLLGVYQLWLDDLYPKAKFRDGLAMVEKVGHSKRMQMERRVWIEATRPCRAEKGVERVGDDIEMSGGLGERGRNESGDEIFGGSGASQGSDGRAKQKDGEMPDDDELDTLMAESHARVLAPKPQQARKKPFEEDDGPDEDELDALMAKQDGSASQAPSAAAAKSASATQPAKNASGSFEDNEDADELDALLAEQG
ncbi:chromosome segregation in meiosis- protein [Teratosphaeriaceae sp. CCFEE 6253]|nr:chromosome segregation in meiosis- protein [Teratosphaeriaceae sp. CCFEE 6253]